MKLEEFESDFDNLEVKEEEEEEEVINQEAHEIVSALETIISEVKDIEPDKIKQVVDGFLSKEDIDEMISIYEKCFSDIPNESSIKQYVLHLFNILQIPITREVEDGTEYLE